MNTKQIWANLAVENVERTAHFYNALGIKPNGRPTKEIASFLFADNGFVIHFFEKSKLAKAFGTTSEQMRSGNEVMFSISAESEADVQEWMRRASVAGGTIFREPKRDEAGFLYGGFADPDGHKFNVLLIEAGM